MFHTPASFPTTDQINERLAALEAQAQADQQNLSRTRRQMRVTWAVSGLAAITLFTMGWHKDAIAQGYGMTLVQAATRITALETKTASMSVVAASDISNSSSKPTVRFSGVNVQIVDGTGATEGAQTGLGNLIIGYNELRDGGNARTGNHNLVAGIFNNYSSNGGVVFGFQNNISSVEATVTGGVFNTASSSQASVSGGSNNTASSIYSSVSGGRFNTANGQYATVSGGYQNTTSNDYCTVSGGSNNTAEGYYSTVIGGHHVRQSNHTGFSAGGGYSASSPGPGAFHSP